MIRGEVGRDQASLVTQMVKNPPTMLETLSWEDPLKEGMATLSSILAWRIPMDRGAWRATVYGVTKSQTRLSNFTFTSLTSGLGLPRWQ